MLYDKKMEIAKPQVTAIGDYSLIAACFLSLFVYVFYNSGQIFLFAIATISIVVMAVNYWLLKQTKNYKRSVTILLAVGTMLTVSVFVDGGFENAGYLWVFPFIAFIFCITDNLSAIVFWTLVLIISCFVIAGFHWAGLLKLPYSSTFLLQFFLSVSLMTGLALLSRKANDNHEYYLSSTRRLMDIAITPIAIVTSGGRIIHTNKAMNAMTGMSQESMVNTQLSSYFENNVVAEELINDVFHNGSGNNIPLTASVMNKKINILCTASVYEEKGQEQNGLFLFKDVTDLVNAENRAKEYADKLEKQNKELDQFAYIVSHDLKAPLRSIANLSEWIREDLGDKLPEESKKNIDLLQNRVSRMTALITAILEYSRIGRLKVEQERVDSRQLLTEIIDTLSLPANFRIHIPSDMPVFKTGKILLQQVFSNLISNAIKYNDKAHGEINISVKELEKFYEFTVMDNGAGIAPEYHEKVFIIFQTLEAKDKVESTGIGLSIVKKIVDEQGGGIKIDSQKGQGAKFIFTWPKEVLKKN